MSDPIQPASTRRRTSRHRSPDRSERQLDAARSRRMLLSAALDEFAAKGFAGANVRDIAARAGLNKQLINYYFGGKEGLYRELQRGWLEREAGFADPELPMEELAARYLHDALDDPRYMRLLAWSGLHDGGCPPGTSAQAPDDRAEMRRRQEKGEVAAGLDPAAVGLAVTAMVAMPVVMPQVVRSMLGIGPSDADFEEKYAGAIQAIIRQLAGVPPLPNS